MLDRQTDADLLDVSLERPPVHIKVYPAHPVNALGRKIGSTRTEDQPALAAFWEGNASVHWNQAANQIALANHLSMSDSNRLLAVLNIAMADTAFTTWSGKRFYGADLNEVTWRPVTSIPLADTDGNPDRASALGRQ